MHVSTVPASQRRLGVRAISRLGVAALAFGLFSFGGASAYIGASFAQLPGIVGGAQGADYKNWLKIEGHYWKSDDVGGIFNRRRGGGLRNPVFYSYPSAPRKGADQLVIAVDKRSPMLSRLMAMCAKKAILPEMTFAESAARARAPAEIGPKPDEVPAFFEYKLKEIEFSSCPAVEGAPDQAFVLSFKDIQWLSAQGEVEGKEVDGRAVTLIPASLPQLRTTGVTKTFVVSWWANANDVSDDQCPKLNQKPPEEAYYAWMSPDAAAKEREALKAKGGVSYENGTMARRGPERLNVCLLPGIARDTGHFAPQTKAARGIDLDGDDGTGAPPKGVCRHKNYVADDGRTGIDHQMYTVLGCMPGYQGHKGFLMQYRNEQRRNGALSVLVQISGIDNEKNDDSINVTILYSKDPMAKKADGSRILPDYTFRLSEEARHTHYVTRVQGRIVDGAIVTEPAKHFQMVLGIDPELNLYEARMHLRIMPDGTLKGVVAGYEDWRKLMIINANSNSENLYGFQCPGLYQAFKRAADGLKDPVTGECNGISSAYDIEGVPAFIPPSQQRTLIAQAERAR